MLILISFIGIVLAQSQVVKLKIVTEKNTPLLNTEVLINNMSVGSTDSEGVISIDYSKFKTNTLKIVCIGYSSRIIKITETENNILQVSLNDLKTELKNVYVKGSIVEKGISPITFSNISAKELSNNYTIQDVPEYLSQYPSTSFYSENGNGIGYNYISIRGFDQRRIAVAVNGVPQNDPEDHNVYWLDFADILGNTELLQVQRGSGKSTNGYPAIGGTVNIVTKSFSDKPEFSFGYSNGSYNTRKIELEYSSGLIDNKYSLTSRFSNTKSDGYRDNSWTNLSSIYLSGSVFSGISTTTLNFYGSLAEDGLAYNGLAKSAITNKDLRTQNLSYFELGEDGDYSYSENRRKEEKERFMQPHFELLNSLKFSEEFKLNNTVFFVQGDGYFDYDGSWGDTTYFRLTDKNGFKPIANPSGSLIRAMVANKQFGWLPSIELKHQNGTLNAGLELRVHNSLHYGNIIYATSLPDGVTEDYRYYEYKGRKKIYSAYLNENYNINDKINLLVEAQLTRNSYRLYDEKYVGTDFTVTNTFFNPKLGLNYKLRDNQNLYMNFAITSREPRLKEYYDAAESSGGALPNFKKNADNNIYDFSNPEVKPERMTDIEFGYNYERENVTFSANGYYMIFKDEIAKNGQLDRFGQPITGNLSKTVHTGLELSAQYKLQEYLSFILNASASNNEIKDGVYYFKYKENNVKKIGNVDLSGNQVAGFSSILINFITRFSYENLFLEISNKYVGKSYSDNFGDNINKYVSENHLSVGYLDNKIEPYIMSNIYCSYTLKNAIYFNSMKIYVQGNNIFNKLYASSATGKEFYPGAERNILVGVKLGF